MKISLKNWNWKRLGTYHFKWQISFIIMWPCLELCYNVLHLSTLPALVLSNFIGALLFYPLDLFIFVKKQENQK
jgi:hypothetical protein